jgi:MFS family permease
MAGYLLDLRRLGPTVGLYFLGVSLVGFALDGGVFAVLLNLFLIRLGYGPELIGVVNSAGTLTFALASVPAGALGGRYGSRGMLLIGIGLMCVGCMLMPLADALPPAWQLPWLISFSIGIYLGLALFFVNTAPFIMGAIDADRRAQVFSLQTALLSLAAFAGSLAGGFLPPLLATLLGADLTEPAPYRYALIVAGAALLPAFFALRAARPGAPPAEPPATPGRAPVDAAGAIFGLLALIAIVRLLQVAGLAATGTFFNVYLDSALLLPTAQIGAIIAAARLLGVPAALTTSWLTKRFGTRTVVIWATFGSALSILPIAFIPHWTAAGLSFIGVTGLSWIRYAASTVYFLELVPPSRRAMVSGVTEMAAGICFTAMTFGGGFVIALYGYNVLFLAGAIVTGLSALIFWLAFRGRGKIED